MLVYTRANPPRRLASEVAARISVRQYQSSGFIPLDVTE